MTETKQYFEPPLAIGFFKCHSREVWWERHVTGWYSCWSNEAGMYLKSDTLKGLKKWYKELAENGRQFVARAK